jgi:hypothetical protein
MLDDAVTTHYRFTPHRPFDKPLSQSESGPVLSMRVPVRDETLRTCCVRAPDDLTRLVADITST